MKALVTGATGLVGSRLVGKLNQAAILGRDPSRARKRLGSGVTAFAWLPDGGLPPVEAFSGADVVFHLAGEPVAASVVPMGRKGVPGVSPRRRASCLWAHVSPAPDTSGWTVVHGLCPVVSSGLSALREVMMRNLAEYDFVLSDTQKVQPDRRKSQIEVLVGDSGPSG